MRGPCSWELPSCTCASCLNETDPTTRAAAIEYATTVLWAATGRRFGLCELTARPCGVTQGQCIPTWGWGMWWNAGGWFPYIGSDGIWRNCLCRGFCTCKPQCEAYLLGPVNSIVDVVVDGSVVDPGTYEVQDGHFLVRTEGGCWPQCPDMAQAGAFEVTYMQGEPLPSILAIAARTLACEFVKACKGEPCRLPGRMSNLFRQGAQVQFVDIDRLMDKGWTGIMEVDNVIVALNPHSLKQIPRVWSPDRPRPRFVTSPTGS